MCGYESGLVWIGMDRTGQDRTGGYGYGCG